jgi:tetratricopeptide (TPR) repeat protein
MTRSQQRQKKPLLSQARWYYDRNRTYKACQCYLKIIRDNPESHEAVADLAALYFDRGDFELAGLCLDHLLKVFPETQELRLKRGLCYLHLDAYGLARQTLSHLPPWNKDIEEERLLALSQCNFNLGYNLQAVQGLTELMQPPGTSYYHLLLAELLENLGLFQPVIKVCERGLKRDPYFQDLMTLKARTHLNLQEFGKAKALYLKMLRNQWPMEEAWMDLEEFLVLRNPPPEILELATYFEDPFYS